MKARVRKGLTVLVALIWVLAVLRVLGVVNLGGAPPEEPPGDVVRAGRPPVLPAGKRPFGGGEELVYELGWNGVPCGRLSMSLKEDTQDGAKALVLEFETRTSRSIEWAWTYTSKGTVSFDPETLLPTLSTRTRTEDKKVKRITTTFDRRKQEAETVTEKLYKKSRSVRRVPFELGLDLPSFLVYLRALDLPRDKPTDVEMIDDEKVYALRLTPADAGELEVKAGRFRAEVVTVQPRLVAGGNEDDEGASYREIRYWLDRERRMPLKMEAQAVVGTVYVELVSFRAGGEEAKAP